MKMMRMGRLWVAVLMVAAGPASAFTYTWTNTAAGTAYTWTNPPSWGGAGYPNGLDDVANLTPNLAGAQGIGLNASIVLGTLNIGDSASGYYTFTLTNGPGGSLTFDVSSGSAQINKAAAANSAADVIGATLTLNDSLVISNDDSGGITLSGPVAGAGGITKAGSGTVTLSGTNAFSGPVAVQNGTLKVDALNYVTTGDWYLHGTGSSLGKPATAADGTIALGSGAFTGTLYRTGTSNEVTDRVIDLAGTTGGAVINNSGANKSIKFTSDFTASGSGDKKLTLFSFSGAGEVAGAIVDSAGGQTTVEGGGTTPWTLSGLSTYSGPTIINNNGGLKVKSIANLGVASAMGAPTSVENGTIRLGVGANAKTLSYFGAGNTTDRVLDLSGTTGGATLDMTGASGTLRFTSDFTASGGGAKTLTVNSGSGSWVLDLAGRIVDSTNGATSLSLVNFGSACYVRLNSTNTYTGSTSIGAWGTGGIYVESLKPVNGGPSSLGNPAPGNGTITMGNGGFQAALIYTNGTGDTTDRPLDLKGTTGGATLDQSGSGLLKFTGDFTASGAGSKTLTLQGSTSGTGEVAGAIVDNSAVNKTSLTKAGTGTWVLSGTNSYTGPTAVNAGTLVLAGTTTCTGTTTVGSGALLVVATNAALGRGPLVLNGGSLQAAADADGVNALTNDTLLTISSTVGGTNAVTFAGRFTQSGNNRTLLGNVGSGKRLILAGPVYLSETNITGRTLSLGGTGTIEISGPIANCYGSAGAAGGLIITNALTILSGTNTFTGTTTIGNGGRLQIGSISNLGSGALVFNAGTVAGNKVTLALRADGSSVFERNAVPNGSTFDQVNEFNLDRATPGGPTDGVITWGTLGSNMVFNNDRGQLLVTGSNGYGLTLNPNLSWAGNNQDDKPNIVNNATGLLTLNGNLTGPSINGRSFELTGTGDIRVNGNISGNGYFIHKTGGNTVTLTGTNTWINNGGFVVDDGTLKMTATTVFYPPAGCTVTRGVWDLNGASGWITSLTMGGGESGTVSRLMTGGGVLTLSNNVTYKGNISNDLGAVVSGFLNLGYSSRTFLINDSLSVTNDLTITANIGSVSGGVNKAGSGTLTLSGTNTYDGTTQISAGMLKLDSAEAVPGGLGVTGGISFIQLNGGMLGLAAGDFTRGVISGTASNMLRFYPGTSGGFAAYGADRFVNLGAATASVTWAAGGFCGGTLMLASPEATHTLDFQNPIALGGAVRTIQVDDGAAAIDAKLSGGVTGALAGNGLVKTGNGVLALKETCSYTGPTIVSNGTLRVDAALGTNTVTVMPGAAIGGTGTVNGVRLVMNTGAKLSVTILPGGVSDALTISGALDVSNLGLDLVNTNLLNRAYRYTVVRCGSHTGEFASANLPEGWIVDYQASGEIKVRTLPHDGVLMLVR